MTVVTVLAIYLLIGMAIAMKLEKRMNENLNRYEERTMEYSRLREESETFEEKCAYRSELVHLEETYETELKFKELTNIFNEKIVSILFMVIIMMIWPVNLYEIITALIKR